MHIPEPLSQKIAELAAESKEPAFYLSGAYTMYELLEDKMNEKDKEIQTLQFQVKVLIGITELQKQIADLKKHNPQN